VPDLKKVFGLIINVSLPSESILGMLFLDNSKLSSLSSENATASIPVGLEA
jgi:hypothetical protein